LTGISADAVQNIKFVEYYTLNASEQDIVQFIENKHVNIEWYNPEKVRGFVDGLEKASAKLWLNYKRLNKNFIANNLGEFEKALNDFNTEVQKSGWVKQNNIYEQIDVVQTFKDYVKRYSDLFKQKDVNNESFMKTLAGIKSKLEEISKGLETFANTNVSKQLSQDELTNAKSVFANMQKTIKAVTAQTMNVTNAYTALKEFAVTIKEKLNANPNDEKRGTVQRRWEGPTNIVNAQ
jgi:predicted RND superfamily exporter protein